MIKYRKEGSIKILYANGNTAEFNQKTEEWVTVNNKGLCKGKKLKVKEETEYDPKPCASKTDPQTGCKNIYTYSSSKTYIVLFS